MQRSIASFFQPMKGKEKEGSKSDGVAKNKTEPVKSPLKPQNGVAECDSPVKKVGKRSRRIIDSDEEGEAGTKEDAVSPAPPPTPERGAVVKAASTVSSPAAPDTPSTPSAPASAATAVTPASSISPGTPSSISPSGILKRKTARKQFPKRKLATDVFGEEDHGPDEQEVKRSRTEGPPDTGEEKETEEMEVDGKNSEESKEPEGGRATVKEEEGEAKGEKEQEERSPEKVKATERSEKEGGETTAAKKANISSFFTPRKAAAKLQKAEDAGKGQSDKQMGAAKPTVGGGER